MFLNWSVVLVVHEVGQVLSESFLPCFFSSFVSLAAISEVICIDIHQGEASVSWEACTGCFTNLNAKWHQNGESLRAALMRRSRVRRLVRGMSSQNWIVPSEKKESETQIKTGFVHCHIPQAIRTISLHRWLRLYVPNLRGKAQKKRQTEIIEMVVKCTRQGAEISCGLQINWPN